MKLSKNTYDLASTVVTGAMTLHDLIKTVDFVDIPYSKRQEMIEAALAELCRHKLVRWWLERDYGNSAPEYPPDSGEETFLKYWHRLLKCTDLSVEVPDKDNPTLFVEPTSELVSELGRDVYNEWN